MTLSIGVIDEARFLSKRVRIGDCWIYTGASVSRKCPYGYFKLQGKQVRAHRLAFALGHGRWPVGNVCHTCDQPKCVNFDHLFEGTQAANITDKVAKNRQAIGRRVATAKLSEELVVAMRARRDVGVTYAALGAEFGVHPSVAWDVVNRETWKHV